jgi:hypothetical protein
MPARECFFLRLGVFFLNVFFFFVRFEIYDEDNVAEAYGQETADLYGRDFPDFDYAS